MLPSQQPKTSTSHVLVARNQQPKKQPTEKLSVLKIDVIHPDPTAEGRTMTTRYFFNVSAIPTNQILSKSGDLTPQALVLLALFAQSVNKAVQKNHYQSTSYIPRRLVTSTAQFQQAQQQTASRTSSPKVEEID